MDNPIQKELFKSDYLVLSEISAFKQTQAMEVIEHVRSLCSRVPCIGLPLPVTTSNNLTPTPAPRTSYQCAKGINNTTARPVERDEIIGLMSNGIPAAKHLADAAAAFDARRGACDTQLEEGTTLTARAACGCGHSPTSSLRSLGRVAAPTRNSVFCHTAIRMRVIPYVAQFLSKIN
ncbi:unnamed protein product [Spodoptera exigua]|nr:unnamed protein product [Spodoptera exigua]